MTIETKPAAASAFFAAADRLRAAQVCGKARWSDVVRVIRALEAVPVGK